MSRSCTSWRAISVRGSTLDDGRSSSGAMSADCPSWSAGLQDSPDGTNPPNDGPGGWHSRSRGSLAVST